MAEKDEATQDAIDTWELWHYHQTIEHRFWACIMSSDWWKQIILDTQDDEKWVQTFRMPQATFMDIFTC